nr:MAG TPA: hypothetical protein [Caudoviricetes sp.]
MRDPGTAAHGCAGVFCFSGKIIFYRAFVAACGRLQTHFHGMGSGRKTTLK